MMKTAEEYAKESWCKLSLGNIARPANFDEVVRELAPYFAAAQREAIEAAAQAVDDTEVVRIGRGYMETDDAQRTLNAAEKAVRALAPTVKP